MRSFVYLQMDTPPGLGKRQDLANQATYSSRIRPSALFLPAQPMNIGRRRGKVLCS
ncbi:hypothetical protein HO173_002295 [Letharia columbiana]|uniref:Uncharacterized protein n=1 Tax=Letharia columbiana TaxID=112416 RepID=A0A8H6G3N8_9LECA|nr:uncharacterized protein HO173_002295 [Letharia columbiana]KAF6239749.1 hypothetical protein HO173_002295 [Letharia columbiana]